MKKILLFLLMIIVADNGFAQISEQNAAQEKKRMDEMNAAMKMENKDGWSGKAGIGIDLGQLININPYVGSGSDRLGLGGAINYKANYQKGLFSWKNDFLLNFTVQRVGSGTISDSSNQKIPFEKALDMFVINSNLAYSVKEGSPWAYSLDLGLRTQLLKSYIDATSKKIYLKELNIDPYHTSLVSKLFSPALITLAPGIKYSKSKYQFFLSPVAGQILIISNQNIANLGVHGTKLKEGSTTEYETSKFSLGALAKASYTNTYFEKLNVSSELSLYSDYLDNPQNIDVIWTNSFGIEIIKGLNLGLHLDLYYDDDKTNNISDSNAIGGISGTGKRINFIEQLFVSYNRSF
jgi:uncharacterized protein YceK